MEQFHYTWCRPGTGVNSRQGWNVRAISQGINDRHAASLCRYAAGYGAPEIADGTGNRTKLALFRPNTGSALLIHSAHVGVIPSIPPRWGNFFSHVVTGLSHDIDALQAISSWRSDFWRLQDDGESQTLLSLINLPTGTFLTPESARKFLAIDRHYQWATFCLSAAIIRDTHQRIIIVGDSDTVAFLIYIVASCAPLSIRRSLSFSTYERDCCTSTDFSIIGTGLESVCELDGRRYDNHNFVLNTFTNSTGKIHPPESDAADELDACFGDVRMKVAGLTA